MIKQGESFEIKISKRYHRRGIPLLVSPMFIRRIGGGQVDLAVILPNEIQIIECKSGYSMISPKQIRRLRDTSAYLSDIFNLRSRLLLVEESGVRLI